MESLLAEVDDAFCLAGGTFDGSGLDERDFRVQADDLLDVAADFRAKLFESFDGVFEHGRLDFHLDFQFVHRLRAGDDQLVVRFDAFDGEQNAFDLRREEVNAADDEHVIAAAANLLHADERTAAGALLINEAGDVMCAVAEERHAFLRDGGQRQFAFFSGRQDFACVGIENFWIVVIFEDVETVVGFAVHGDAWAHDFGKAEHVMRFDTGLLLDEIAHAFRPRLRAENAEAELRVMAEIKTDFFCFFNQMDEEGRRAADDGCTEVGIKSVRQASSAKAILSGRTLGFTGVKSAATVEVLDLQGQVVAKGDASKSLSLASLDAGIYMVRVTGKSVNFVNKIVLK